MSVRLGLDSCQVGLGLVEHVGVGAHLVLAVRDVDHVHGQVAEAAQHAGELLAGDAVVLKVDLIHRVGAVLLAPVGKLAGGDPLKGERLQLRDVVDDHRAHALILGVAGGDAMHLALQLVDRVHVGGVDVAALGQGHQAAVDVEHVHVGHLRAVLRGAREVGLAGSRVAVDQQVHLGGEHLGPDQVPLSHLSHPIPTCRCWPRRPRGAPTPAGTARRPPTRCCRWSRRTVPCGS